MIRHKAFAFILSAGVVAALGSGANAAVIVPNTDMSGGTVTGTLLGISAATSQTTFAPEFSTTDPTPAINNDGNVNGFGGTRYWQCDRAFLGVHGVLAASQGARLGDDVSQNRKYLRFVLEPQRL